MNLASTINKKKNQVSVSGSHMNNDGNYCYIPPTLDGWVYIDPTHGPLDGPLYTWAQYTPTNISVQIIYVYPCTSNTDPVRSIKHFIKKLLSPS